MAGLKPWERAAAERGVPVQRGGVFIPKATDPYKGKEDSRQDAELGLKREGLALRRDQIASAEADRREANELRRQAFQLRQQEAKRGSPEMQKKTLGDQSMRSDLGGIQKQIARVEDLYNRNFRGVGPGSLLEYLPTPARSQFDTANELLSTSIKPLIRGPGEGTWTDADQAKLDKLILGGGRDDAANEESLRGLKALVQQRQAKHGAPAKGWTVKRIK